MRTKLNFCIIELSIINKVSADNITSSDKDTSKNKTTAENNSGKVPPAAVSTEQVKILLKNGDSGDKVSELQKKLYTVASTITESNPAQEVPQGLTSIPDIKTSPGDSQQVIVVLAQSYGTINASFKTYEKKNGFWQVINSGSAVTGKKGFSDSRQEGDLTSPTGKYGKHSTSFILLFFNPTI